jgi:hypothetical protein
MDSQHPVHEGRVTAQPGADPFHGPWLPALPWPANQAGWNPAALCTLATPPRREQDRRNGQPCR